MSLKVIGDNSLQLGGIMYCLMCMSSARPWTGVKFLDIQYNQ